MATVLSWLFRASTERDGASAALEAIATGVPPPLLEPDAGASTSPVTGRRDRALAGGERVLIESVAEKVLHGWLQNRHQTLFPLTVNLRTLEAAQAVALANWMAVALLATTDRPKVDVAKQQARAWLGSAGADPATLTALDTAFAAPPALHQALAAVAGPGVSAYAYVVALIATDPHDPATPPFLDFAAARLALPDTVVRSATRRYRR